MSGKRNVGGTIWQEPDDAPELTDALFEEAIVYDGPQVVRRGRPKAALPKAQVTLRLDADAVGVAGDGAGVAVTGE